MENQDGGTLRLLALPELTENPNGKEVQHQGNKK